LSDPLPLRRSLSLPLITLYGLGTILGAGIYVLIGEVAANAGMGAPVAFVIASVLAALSAFSYAELASRYPISAGEAVYAERAFGRVWLARAVGLMLVAVGIVSSATLVNGFVGYLHVFLDAPDMLVVSVTVIGLGAVAAWGINQSAWLAVASTVVEVFGLLLVIWAAGDTLPDAKTRWPEMIPGADATVWAGLAVGAFVAFYAFIGFEDIVNVAEEVKDPTRNLAAAVLLSLFISTTLYVVVAVTAILAVEPQTLGGSAAPLALVYQKSTGQDPYLIALISLAAVIGGALVQIIMASRILYGMSRQGWLPLWLARVHPRTRTPLPATALITAAILIMTLTFPLITLAETTSLITLMVFTVVNLSLWRIKRREPHPPGIRVFPSWLPICGAIASAGFILLHLIDRFSRL